METVAESAGKWLNATGVTRFWPFAWYQHCMCRHFTAIPRRSAVLVDIPSSRSCTSLGLAAELSIEGSGEPTQCFADTAVAPHHHKAAPPQPRQPVDCTLTPSR